MRPAVTTLLGLCGVFCALPASALGHGDVALGVERRPGTEQCIETAALERAVEARLHRTVFTTQPSAQLRIDLVLDHATDTQWSAELSLRTASGASLGQRRIETSARHCSALDDSLALVIALLVDSPPPVPAEAAPLAAPGSIPPMVPSPLPVNPASPAKPAPATTIQLPSDTHAPREPWHADVAAGAALTGGVLPGVAFGPEASLGFKPAYVPEVRLFGGLLGQRESRVGSSASGARFGFAYVGLELCPGFAAPRRLRPFACLGQVVGRLRAEAFGFDENRLSNLLRFALQVRLGIALSITGPLSLRLDGRGELPMTHSVFVYGARNGQEGGIYKTSPVAGVLELALALAWR
ncbi:MAG TPA: hypothetical protein VNW92_23970 [Polyangiaceae bacterium]|jgi:hypothetical protein|nr:hypothetical protein [Polyangiaceae bacterium]